MILDIGPNVLEKTSSGNQVLRAHVSVADDTTAVPAVFDAKVVHMAQKAFERNKALR